MKTLVAISFSEMSVNGSQVFEGLPGLFVRNLLLRNLY